MAEGARYGRADGGESGIPPCLENQVENPVFLGSAAVCLAITAMFAACSLGAVPPLFYGLRYNVFNKAADIENVYGPGRYFIMPWNTFILFPANVQTIEFTSESRLAADGLRFPALHSRTKEGLALHLQVSLQYQLKYDQVGLLYNEFNKNYEQMFTSTIRDTLIKAASGYEAYQLWEERAAVGEKMQNMVDTALKRTYADCWGLQLMTIELPEGFENSIVQTQVNTQRVSTQQFQQEATRVRAETDVIAATFDRQVTVIMAQGKANYTYITKEAKAKAKFKTLGIEANVVKSIKENLGLSSAELIQYARFNAVKELQNASVLYGFDENTPVLMSQSPVPSPPVQQDIHSQVEAPAKANVGQGAGADSGISGPANRLLAELDPANLQLAEL